jgi:hypothetical protein
MSILCLQNDCNVLIFFERVLKLFKLLKTNIFKLLNFNFTIYKIFMD